MNYRGQYEQIIETTLGRYQNGGILVNDIVKIKKDALKHPKIKELDDVMKQNIQTLIDTDLNITVTAVRSIWGSRGELSDGLGMGSTTAPDGFFVDVAVLHSPGLKSDPITLPIEVVERQDFEGNLPPIPDSLVRKNNVNIKPIEAGPYDNQRGDKYQNPTKNVKIAESLETIYESIAK